jgi:hypothetical protein
MPNAGVNTYRILSVDGGGSQGIIAFVLFYRLDLATPGWRKNVNMHAGTSKISRFSWEKQFSERVRWNSNE